MVRELTIDLGGKNSSPRPQAHPLRGSLAARPTGPCSTRYRVDSLVHLLSREGGEVLQQIISLL